MEIRNSGDAKKYGITLIHQETMTIPNLSIAENIFISRLKIARYLDIDKLVEEAKKYLEIVGINKDPKTKVKELRVAEQQLVQFARALAEDARIICVDELTSALNPLEVKHVFDVMREFKDKGKSFIFITHRINEVFSIADRITVFRDGFKVLTKNVFDTNPDEVVKAMVGRSMEELYVVKEKKLEKTVEEPILKVVNLTTAPVSYSETPLKNISFELYENEILGVVGLLGAGKTELGKALIGMQKIISGEIYMHGKRVKIRNPIEARKYGIVYLPEDRKKEGVVAPLSVADNILISVLARKSVLSYIREKQKNDIASKWVKELGIVTPSTKSKVINLSGGNQQKVIIARSLEANAKIFIFDEPTFGIDIGAKAEIRRLIKNLVEERKGIAIILLTSDVDEALSLSDKIMILRNGEMVRILPNINLDRDHIVNLLGG